MLRLVFVFVLLFTPVFAHAVTFAAGAREDGLWPQLPSAYPSRQTQIFRPQLSRKIPDLFIKPPVLDWSVLEPPGLSGLSFEAPPFGPVNGLENLVLLPFNKRSIAVRSRFAARSVKGAGDYTAVQKVPLPTAFLLLLTPMGLLVARSKRLVRRCARKYRRDWSEEDLAYSITRPATC